MESRPHHPRPRPRPSETETETIPFKTETTPAETKTIKIRDWDPIFFLSIIFLHKKIVFSLGIFFYTKNIIFSLGISTTNRVLFSWLYFHFFLLQVLWSRYSSLERLLESCKWAILVWVCFLYCMMQNTIANHCWCLDTK